LTRKKKWGDALPQRCARSYGLLATRIISLANRGSNARHAKNPPKLLYAMRQVIEAVEKKQK